MSTLTPAQYERIKDRLTEEERVAVERALGIAKVPDRPWTPTTETTARVRAERMAATLPPVEPAKPKPEPQPEPEPEPREPRVEVPALEEPQESFNPPETTPSDDPIGVMKVPSQEGSITIPGVGKVHAPGILGALYETVGGGRDVVNVDLPGAKKLVGEYGARLIKDIAERKTAAAKEELGRELTDEEVKSIQSEAAADAEDALFGQPTSALNQDRKLGPLGEVVTTPGETAGEFKYNAPQAVQLYENALINRATVDWIAANPGKQMTDEERDAIVSNARDTAKRDVFSVIGWSPSRQNAFVPLDPVERQIEKIREADAPGLLGTSMSTVTMQSAAKGVYELAYGPGSYRNSTHAKIVTPFIAALTPGFTQSDMVDYEGRPIGPATREHWLYSATRAPFSAPFAAYFYGDGVKEWNDDAHLKALAEGVDLTTVGAQVGMQIGEYTLFDLGTAGQAAVGTMAIMPFLMLDPDIPSFATFGFSEVVKGLGSARKAAKAVALANAKKADAMADLLEESGEAVGDAIMIDPNVDAYVAETSKYSRPGSGGIESNESLMIKDVEARAKLRVGAEMGADIAPSLSSASKHSEILREAEQKWSEALVAQDAAKERLRRNMAAGEELDAVTKTKALEEWVDAAAARQDADESVVDAVRRQVGAQEVADRTAADRTAMARKQAMAGPQAKLDDEVAKMESAPATWPAPEEAVTPPPREFEEFFREQEAIRKVVKEIRSQATVAAAEAKAKLDELRKLVGSNANPKRLEEIIEQSRVQKQKMAEVKDAIAQLEAIPKKDLDPASAEQLRQLRLSKLALDRQTVIDIADGSIAGAIESWKTARGAHAATIAKAMELEAKLGDPDLVRAARSAYGEADAAAKRAAARNARLTEMRDREVAKATDRVMKANDALVKARQTVADIRLGPDPDAAKALEKANRGVEAATRAVADAKVALQAAVDKYKTVSDAPLKAADQKLVKAIFSENADAVSDLIKKSGAAKQQTKNITAAMRYKEILREEYRNLAKSYRELAALPTDAPVTAGAARAKTALDTVALRGNDSMSPWGNKTFKYNFDSELGLRANLMNVVNLMRLRAGSRYDRFFERVAARGFGPMQADLRANAARSFGRFRGTVNERNEVNKQSQAARKASQARARKLVEELKTATPDRAVDIQKELGRIESEVVKDDYDFITSAESISYGKHKDGTVTNTLDGLGHADRCLQYLKIIHSGGNEVNDLVTTGLARIWMPSGAGPAEADEIEKLARSWLAEIVKDSKTGVEFVERLRSPDSLPFAAWARDVGEVEGRLRAWDFLVRGIIAGSTMRDGVFDLLRAAGPRLTSADAAAFNVLAAMPSKSLTADAIKAMADKGITDLKRLDETIAKYGTGYTQESVTRWRPFGKGEAASLRLLKLGVDQIGDEVVLPEHVFRAMQDIPDRFAKNVSQWDVEQNPGVALFNAWLAMKRMNMVYGTWIPRLRQYSVQPIGDWSQAAVDIGPRTATRSTVASGAWLLPGIAGDVGKYLHPSVKSMLGPIADGDFGKIMRADKDAFFEVAEGRISALDLNRECLEERLWTSMGSDALQEMRAKNMFAEVSKQPWYRKLFETLYEPNRLVEGMADQLEELQKRQRYFVYCDLRLGKSTGVKMTREAAAKATRDSMFDWQLGVLPWENDVLGKLFLFHNYRRNAVRRRTGMLTEAMTTPGHEYLLKAMVGQTKLGRTVSFGQVLATATNAISYEDPDQLVSDREAFEQWGARMFPWFADTLSIVSREALTPAEREFEKRVTGRDPTHAMWATAPLAFMDDLHVLHTIGLVAATTAVWGYEQAGGRGDVTHTSLNEVYLEASKMLTDMVTPTLRKHAEALASKAITGEARSAKEVSISRDTALAMDRLGVRFPLVRQNDNGKYVLDGIFAETVAALGTEILPAYQDAIRTVAVTNNPSYNDGVVQGAVESMGKLFGLFSRTTYDPATDRMYEEQRKASELKEMIKEADPFDNK